MNDFFPIDRIKYYFSEKFSLRLDDITGTEYKFVSYDFLHDTIRVLQTHASGFSSIVVYDREFFMENIFLNTVGPLDV